jgi:hypothetical protein
MLHDVLGIAKIGESGTQVNPTYILFLAPRQGDRSGQEHYHVPKFTLAVGVDSVVVRPHVLARRNRLAKPSRFGRVPVSIGDRHTDLQLHSAKAVTIAAGGDASSSAGSTATALALATVNANVGSWGSASAVAAFTVDAKGCVTAAGTANIAIAITAVTGLQTALDGKAASVHGHAISDVTGLQSALDGKLDDSQAATIGTGKHSVYIPAGSMMARTTNGADRHRGANLARHPRLAAVTSEDAE